MDNTMQFDKHDPLADPLQREAQFARPDFSEALHARLRAAILDAGQGEPPATQLPATRLPVRLPWREKLWNYRRFWAFAAAACVVAVGVALLAQNLLGRRGGPGPSPVIAREKPVTPLASVPVESRQKSPFGPGRAGTEPIGPGRAGTEPFGPGRAGTEPDNSAVDDLDSTADLVERTALHLGQWMATTVDENQWAGLDRDAQSAVAAVTGPLPFDF
jgi:hypothetical protein